MLKTTRILIYLLINILNFGSFFALVFYQEINKRLIFDLSFHCLFFNLIYFLTILIIEVKQEFWHSYSYNLLPFFRNQLFKWISVLNFYSFLAFYILVLLGPNFKKFPEDFLQIFFTIFLNGGQLIIIITEFYLANHSFLPKYFADLFFIISYFQVYLMICYAGIEHKIYAFDFMKISNISQNFVGYFLSILLILNFYLGYQTFLTRKNAYNLNLIKERKRRSLEKKNEIEMNGNDQDKDINNNKDDIGNNYNNYNNDISMNTINPNEKEVNLREKFNENFEENETNFDNDNVIKEKDIISSDNN